MQDIGFPSTVLENSGGHANMPQHYFRGRHHNAPTDSAEG